MIAKLGNCKKMIGSRGDAINIDLGATCARAISTMNAPGRNAGAIAEEARRFLNGEPLINQVP